MTLLRSFPISPIFDCQPSAAPARGKGDRRAMAVIHTASRRQRPETMFLFCSQSKRKGKRDMRDRADFAPFSLEEKAQLLLLGDTFWRENPIVMPSGVEVRTPI
jgi:hypothetical protein